MAEIRPAASYTSAREATIPKPDHPVFPEILTAQDGVPVSYAGCHGIGVRVVHPVNPRCTAQNMGLVLFYLPPHVLLPVGCHETEETYCILEGSGVMTFAEGRRDEVRKGMFVHMPPWCEHGIENTGNETLVVLIATSPPNP